MKEADWLMRGEDKTGCSGLYHVMFIYILYNK